MDAVRCFSECQPPGVSLNVVRRFFEHRARTARTKVRQRGFEATPLRTGAWSWRPGPLGRTVDGVPTALDFPSDTRVAGVSLDVVGCFSERPPSGVSLDTVSCFCEHCATVQACTEPRSKKHPAPAPATASVRRIPPPPPRKRAPHIATSPRQRAPHTATLPWRRSGHRTRPYLRPRGPSRQLHMAPNVTLEHAPHTATSPRERVPHTATSQGACAAYRRGEALQEKINKIFYSPPSSVGRAQGP